MAARTGTIQEEVTGQAAFVALVSSTFDVAADQALIAYGKLRSMILDNGRLKGLYVKAGSGTLGSYDDTFDHVSNGLTAMNVRAVVRQVLIPLGVGWLTLALLPVGLLSSVIAALVTVLLFLFMAPGTLRDIRARLSDAIDRALGRDPASAFGE